MAFVSGLGGLEEGGREGNLEGGFDGRWRDGPGRPEKLPGRDRSEKIHPRQDAQPWVFCGICQF